MQNIVFFRAYLTMLPSNSPDFRTIFRFSFWEREKASFTVFPHFRTVTSGARNESLRPALKSGLWRGNVVGNLLTFGHLKVLFSLFLILEGAFPQFMYPRKFMFCKRKDTTTKCIKHNLLIVVTLFQIWLWIHQFSICLFSCLFTVYGGRTKTQ